MLGRSSEYGALKLREHRHGHMHLFYLYPMKAILAAFSLLLCFTTTRAQDINVYSAERLMERVGNEDTLYVINFWATWCGPCVKELPEFNRLNKQYAGKPVKVLMVSLDFKDAYPKKLASFIRKKKMQPEVVWLSETNANEFIPRIEPGWQGSIPATLLIYGKKQYRNFYEGSVTAKQLALMIDRQFAF